MSFPQLGAHVTRVCWRISDPRVPLARLTPSTVGLADGRSPDTHSRADRRVPTAVRALDEITRELVQVQDDLLATDPHDQQTLGLLRERQLSLRTEARQYASQLVDPRSTVEIKLELTARRDQLTRLRKQRIDLVKQSSAGSGTSMDALPEASLNRKLMKAHGAADIRARIAHLEQLLERRNQEPS